MEKSWFSDFPIEKSWPRLAEVVPDCSWSAFNGRLAAVSEGQAYFCDVHYASKKCGGVLGALRCLRERPATSDLLSLCIVTIVVSCYFGVFLTVFPKV